MNKPGETGIAARCTKVTNLIVAETGELLLFVHSRAFCGKLEKAILIISVPSVLSCS